MKICPNPEKVKSDLPNNKEFSLLYPRIPHSRNSADCRNIAGSAECRGRYAEFRQNSAIKNLIMNEHQLNLAINIHKNI